ncbi:MAG: hypothetical protein WDM70_07605 [Nitrosomonadales bacterium]
MNFSAIGKDVIEDKIIRNVGAGFAERREVSVKNALVDLANKLAKLSEPNRDQVEVTAGAYIASAGKVFFPQQKGVVLRKAKIQLGKSSQQVWIPTTEAFVEPGEDVNKMHLSLGLPLINPEEKIEAGNVFEVQRLGVTPHSAQTFTVCGPAESLGALLTPSLLDLTSQALGNKMPGMFYAPSVVEDAKNLIRASSNFESPVQWKIPAIDMCVQPVERVNAGEDQCPSQCDRPITARYTLRVKAGSEIVSRTGFEGQFRSTSFYKETPADQIKRLIDSDLIDEAQTLLDKAADKINFQAK